MATDEIKGLPAEEKILIMETLWDGLRDHFEQAKIPESHKLLLVSRHQSVESGDSKVFEWDDVEPSIGRP